MHADEARRIGHPRGHAGDRDRAGVGGKDGIIGQHLHGAFEDLVLDLFALGRRLDDDRRLDHGCVFADGRDAGHHGLRFGRGHLVALHQLVQRLADLVLAVVRDVLVHVRQQHLVAMLGGRLGDASAHLPRADDADDLHEKSFALSKKRVALTWITTLG